ncbi:MAG: apolipoprotein N-acyltransferase [Deltaproteobacteria bacterium]|nr:apolipoprotein N-acyltransferase [Deltaproteobacteria bacterium]
MWAVRGSTGRQHFLIGLWAGTVTNLGGFYWIAGMLVDFGHMSALPAWLITLLMVTYQGLVFGLWTWLLHALRGLGHGAWLLAPLCYVAAESLVWFIFPWYYGNSQYLAIPLIQVCELGGVTLLSFLLLVSNGALFDALQAVLARRKWAAVRMGALAVCVPAAMALYGLVRMSMLDAEIEHADKLAIGLVEADVGIWEKEDRRKVEDNLVRHQRLSIELERRGAELIVWPETAYPSRHAFARLQGRSRMELHRDRALPRNAAQLPQSRVPPPLHATEDRAARVAWLDRRAPQRGFRTPLLFGALTSGEKRADRSGHHSGRYQYNTALLLDEQGKVLGAYDKVYLLLFGETIPFSEHFPVVYEWLPEAGDVTPGETVVSLPFREHRLGIMICYEDILPAFIRQVARTRPHVLINLTNDAWFGKTSEPYLHMALAVFRTVESRLALVRSTNTGVSCFVDPVGRILAETSLEGDETLLGRVPMMEGGTLYQKLGDWPAYGAILTVAILLLRVWRGRRRRSA